MAKRKSGRSTVDWVEAFKPLFKKYARVKHPLKHENRFQLLVLVILSARTSDQNINAIAPALFHRFPSISSLATARPEELYPYIKTVTNFMHKADWLVRLSKMIGEDKHIPTTMETLTALPGIGRKSANVIMSESGLEMEGVMVDLHVMRDAPRIGVATGTTPEDIEKQLMEKFPRKHWKELGISLTHLGREICRPTHPRCDECPMNSVCEYYASTR